MLSAGLSYRPSTSANNYGMTDGAAILDLESQPLKKSFRAQSRLNQSLASYRPRLQSCWATCS